MDSVYLLTSLVVAALVAWVGARHFARTPTIEKKRLLLIETTMMSLLEAELDLEDHQAKVLKLRARLKRLQASLPVTGPLSRVPEVDFDTTMAHWLSVAEGQQHD